MWAERLGSFDELACARSLSSKPGFAWLDSNRAPSRDGRYSYLTAWPTDEIRVPFGAEDPFGALRVIRPESEPYAGAGPKPSEVPRWIGYVAYDAFWSAPPRGTPRFERQEPILLFRRYPALIAVDHARNEGWIVGDDPRACEALRGALNAEGLQEPIPPVVGPIEVDEAATHRRAIERALDYIAAGDVYEVNLARRWSASFEGDALSLWQEMRLASRVPLGLFLDAGDHAVLACTMERFIHWDSRSRRLVTRPIKGTIRREPTDDGASERLRADPKERAEHSMIVDLMRNDLGRVAEVGTVRVDAPMVVEPFTGLYHLVSTVSCTTTDAITLAGILEATFPPGSVTGAPKMRALEIIEELESHPRGVYCGALGFIDREGGLSLAVAIRTATVRDGEVLYWAGGGIVEASDPAREVAETELKARVFLDAVQSLREARHGCTDR
jgi:para-aminobenzoate synthetase component 1